MDKLTGTYNRGAIEDFIQHELNTVFDRNKPLSIAFIDIDDFKIINDNYGHQAGDDCLRAFTHYIKNSLTLNAQIGRYGGDEFIIVMPKTNPEDAFILIDNLQKNLTPLDFNAQVIKYSISVGVASQSKNTTNIKSILKKADKALYLSKEKGKNTVSLA